MTKIVKCTCNHKYQDNLYGSGMRVANQLKIVKDRTPQYRCTVCKAIH